MNTTNYFHLVSVLASSFDFFHSDNPTPPVSMVATTPKEYIVGTSTPKNSATILHPINPSTIATAGSRYSRSDAAFDKIV